MKVVWLLTAQDHVELIYEFLAQKSQRAASELYNLIISEVDKLAVFPEMAPVEPSLCKESLSYRSLIVSKTYKVIYRID